MSLVIIVCGRHGLWPSLSNPSLITTQVDTSVVMNEYIVLTASEKDSMATSYITLNTISTKPLLSIAASLISDDY